MKILVSNKIKYLITLLDQFCSGPGIKIPLESTFLSLCPTASLVSTLCTLNVPVPTPSAPLFMIDPSV